MENSQLTPNPSINSTKEKNMANNKKNKSQQQSERQSSKLPQCNSDIENDHILQLQQQKNKSRKSKKGKSKKRDQPHQYQQEIIDLDKEDIQKKYMEQVNRYKTAKNHSNQSQGNNRKSDKQNLQRQRQNKPKKQINMHQTQKLQNSLPAYQKQKPKKKESLRQSGNSTASQSKWRQIVGFIKTFLQIWIVFAYQTLLTIYRLTKQLFWYLYCRGRGLWIRGELTILLFLASFILLMLPIGLPVLQFIVSTYVYLRSIQPPTLQMYDDEAIF